VTNFDGEQATAIATFMGALVTVIRIAERKLDRSRNGPISPRVRQLEEKTEELDVRLATIEHRDLHYRLERVEAYIRQDIRNNAE
jgi:hypothetical protein